MLRGAIANHPGYSSAMAALGVTLQAKNQVTRDPREEFTEAQKKAVRCCGRGRAMARCIRSQSGSFWS